MNLQPPGASRSPRPVPSLRLGYPSASAVTGAPTVGATLPASDGQCASSCIGKPWSTPRQNARSQAVLPQKPTALPLSLLRPTRGNSDDSATTATSLGRSASTSSMCSAAPVFSATPVCSASPRDEEGRQHIAAILVGVHTREGRKLCNPGWLNQDAHLVIPLGATRILVAVFDGHGQFGHLVAARVREVFVQMVPEIVPKAPCKLGDAEAGAALVRLFALAQQSLLAEFDAQDELLARFSGTTATVALVDSAAGTVAFAHVGDSALLLTSGGQAVLRTVDHVVDSEAERRILARGGEVRALTISGITARRVCLPGSRFPGLAMSRALGDLVAQDLGVLSEPQVSTGVPFTPETSLIIASDGVWEKVSVGTAALLVEQSSEPQGAAWSLVEKSRARWQDAGDVDDITAVVVRALSCNSRSSSGPRPSAPREDTMVMPALPRIIRG